MSTETIELDAPRLNLESSNSAEPSPELIEACNECQRLYREIVEAGALNNDSRILFDNLSGELRYGAIPSSLMENARRMAKEAQESQAL